MCVCVCVCTPPSCLWGLPFYLALFTLIQWTAKTEAFRMYPVIPPSPILFTHIVPDKDFKLLLCFWTMFSGAYTFFFPIHRDFVCSTSGHFYKVNVPVVVTQAPRANRVFPQPAAQQQQAPPAPPKPQPAPGKAHTTTITPIPDTQCTNSSHARVLSGPFRNTFGSHFLIECSNPKDFFFE